MKNSNQNGNMCIPQNNLPKVVVIGAGFAGVNFVRKLKNQRVQVILIDKNNFHQFQPLLYQVAIAGLEPDSIVSPIRKMFHGYDNLVFRMADVIRVDSENKTVITDIGWVQYDYLVIATGSTTNYYGLDQIEQNSLGLKDIRDALDIRSWVLQNLEEAAITCDLEHKVALTHFVIVGGGPAGVELAGSLAEFKKYLLKKDYPELTKDLMKIYLVQSSDSLLPTFSKKASTQARKVLENLEVEVMLNTTVTNYDGLTVSLKGNINLIAKVLIWTAGVKGDFPLGIKSINKTNNNRLQVDEFNKIEGYQDIFAIGDVSSMISKDYPFGHPMIAQVAIQEGRLLAENILHKIEYGVFMKPFKYINKGIMATIGKRNAVADIGKFNIKGWIAWILWSTVHLFSIIGFKNKLAVGLNWFLKYVTYEKANRIIIRRFVSKHSFGSGDSKKSIDGHYRENLSSNNSKSLIVNHGT